MVLSLLVRLRLEYELDFKLLLKFLSSLAPSKMPGSSWLSIRQPSSARADRFVFLAQSPTKATTRWPLCTNSLSDVAFRGVLELELFSFFEFDVCNSNT